MIIGSFWLDHKNKRRNGHVRRLHGKGPRSGPGHRKIPFFPALRPHAGDLRGEQGPGGPPPLRDAAARHGPAGPGQPPDRDHRGHDRDRSPQHQPVQRDLQIARHRPHRQLQQRRQLRCALQTRGVRRPDSAGQGPQAQLHQDRERRRHHRGRLAPLGP